jgi:hypothetical protein
MFSHGLARAKSDEGGYLATLAGLESTTLEQGNGSILASEPRSILASAEVELINCNPIWHEHRALIDGHLPCPLTTQ